MTGLLDGAVEGLTTAIDMDPTDSAAFANRANAEYALGDLEAALKDFDKCLAPASISRAVQSHSTVSTSTTTTKLASKAKPGVL